MRIQLRFVIALSVAAAVSLFSQPSEPAVEVIVSETHTAEIACWSSSA